MNTHVKCGEVKELTDSHNDITLNRGYKDYSNLRKTKRPSDAPEGGRSTSPILLP